MPSSHPNLDWSPKVPPERIRRLYDNDQRDIFDEDLLREVGYSLVARCKDILEVSEAIAGVVHCRSCGQIIPRINYGLSDEDDEVLRCSRCGWQLTWRDYFQSFTGRQLRGGEVVHIYREFVERFESAQSPQAKMLAIDALIHEFHTNLGKPTKPVAVTVIGGSSARVKQLIEDLAFKS